MAEKIAEVEIEEESVPEEEFEEVTKIPDVEVVTEKPTEVIPEPKAPEEIKPKVEKPKPTPEPKVVEEAKPKVEKPKAVEPKVEKPKKKVVQAPKIEPLMPSTESPEEMVSSIIN